MLFYSLLEKFGYDREPNEISGGIYDVSNCEVLRINNTEQNLKPSEICEAKAFIAKYRNTFCFAETYGIPQGFLLSCTPKKIENKCDGTGFEHGSMNIIGIPEGCTKIMILAQND